MFQRLFTNQQAHHKEPVHIVKPHETLSGIAQKHHISPWNKLLTIPGNEGFKANPDLIHPKDVVHLGANHDCSEHHDYQ